MKDYEKFWENKISEINASPIKWHQDLIYLLDIIYSLSVCLNDSHIRNILFYQSFHEAKEEFEKRPFLYFEDAKINNKVSLLNWENIPNTLPGEKINEDAVFNYINGKSHIKIYLIRYVQKIILEENKKERDDLIGNVYPMLEKYMSIIKSKKKPRLKKNSISFISYQRIMDIYIKSKRMSERHACKIVFDELAENHSDFETKDFQSYLNSFRVWYSNKENQKTYNEISKFLKEKERRAKKKNKQKV